MKKIFLPTLLITLIICICVSGCLTLPQEKAELEQPVQKSSAVVNLNEVKNVVSSEKPEMFLQESTEAGEKGETMLTVYNNDLALVSETREIDLTSGLNQINYSDVPEKILAESFTIKDEKGTVLLEKVYEYDLVSNSALLENYLNKRITVQVFKENELATIAGRLLSYADGLVLETDSGVTLVKNYDLINFPEGTELRSKPSLVLKADAKEAGKRTMNASYLTGGFNWNADYSVVLSEDEKKINLDSWIRVQNASGTSYPNTKLKLVAGEIHRASQGFEQRYYVGEKAYPSAMAESQFVEMQLFEYHVYSLDKKTDLMNNQDKALLLDSVEGINVKKEFLFDAQKSDRVVVNISFKNSEENLLGTPMPKGYVKIYKRSADGLDEFIGEDSIEHTAKDKELNLEIGKAFDLSAERKQTEAESISERCQSETWSVKLTNSKSENVTVKVLERFYYTELKVTNASQAYEMEDSKTVKFFVNVPANSEKTVEYTIRGCW